MMRTSEVYDDVLEMASSIGLTAAATGFRTVAYFASWSIYGRKYTPASVPISQITHLNYAFADIKPDTGAVYLVSCMHYADRCSEYRLACNVHYADEIFFSVFDLGKKRLSLMLGLMNRSDMLETPME